MDQKRKTECLHHQGELGRGGGAACLLGGIGGVDMSLSIADGVSIPDFLFVCCLVRLLYL